MEKFYKLLYWFFNYEKLGRFPLVMMLCIYLLPALMGMVLFNDHYARSFLLMLILSCAVYAVSYYWILQAKIFGKFSPKFNWNRNININQLILAIFGGYIIFFLYVIFTAPHIAIVESLRGMDGYKIAIAREEFLKARTGGERVLVYINAIFTSALMPYLLALLYIVKHRFRHLILGIFILALTASLEKVLVLKALLPLLVLAVNDRFLKKKYAPVILCLIFGVILSTSFLANIRPAHNSVLVKIQEVSKNEAKLIASQKGVYRPSDLQLTDLKVNNQIGMKNDFVVVSSKQDFLGFFENKIVVLENYYKNIQDAIKENPRFLFGANTLSYLLNRALWIPYITAYDWLGYFDKKRNHEYFLGSTNGTISALFGLKRVYAEREVFSYQYGQVPDGTGVANAIFFIEGYVNFSWMGIIFYSFLLALITHIFVKTNDCAAKSVYFYFIYMISVGPLSSVLLSNGLILLIFIVTLKKSDHYDRQVSYIPEEVGS